VAKGKWTPEQQEIVDLDADWSAKASAAAKTKRPEDVEKVVAFYSTTGAVVWPDMDIGRGTDAIRKNWQDTINGIEGMTLQFSPVQIDIVGDLAADYGDVALGHIVPNGEYRIEAAKYVVVWRREGERWKVMYDCWSYKWPAR
jgi:ketosteroid isomerase-like protein